MNEFFKRVLQIVEYKGFNSINDLAKSGLGYGSSEKISRLKVENNKPSYDIILDFANSFKDIDMNWFVTGRGHMLKDKSDILPEDTVKEVKEPSIQMYELVENSQVLKAKEEIIEILKSQNEDLKADKKIFVDLLNSKIFNNQ